jgi:hypothetical protein
MVLVFEDYASVSEWFFIECASMDYKYWRDYFTLAKEVSLDEWMGGVIKKETLQKTFKWKDAKRSLR